MKRDPSLDALLELHNLTLVIDPESKHWVRFVVHEVSVTIEKPHGLTYSLTLHGSDNERLIGFDNAHSIRKQTGLGRKPIAVAFDHKHRLRTILPYEYSDAATLLTDFWNEVDVLMREKGVFK